MKKKQIKPKLCGAESCSDTFIPRNSLQKTCFNPVCAIEYSKAIDQKKRDRATKKIVKAENKKHAQRKRKFYDSDLKTRKKAAKIACHSYIRERDRGLTCICCGRALGPKYDAGHWLESGNYSATRYDEDNIHGQNVHCNQYKGGDSGDYEKNLRIKIGDFRVDALIAKKNITVKRTAQDYHDIENSYKHKLKLLQDFGRIVI